MRKFLEMIRNAAHEKNIIAKGTSLLLAVILWMMISNSQSGSLSFSVPIEISNLPQNAVISETEKQNVLVAFTGKKENLKNINIKNIRVFVDLSKPRIGVHHMYRLRLSKQNIPEDIAINLSLKKVGILVERRVDKRVRVIPIVTGTVMKGMIIGKAMAVPEMVMISGPKSIVDTITIVNTEEVSVQNENSEIVRDVQIKRDDFRNVVIFRDTVVKVNIPIYEIRYLRSIKIPISVRNTIPCCTFVPSPAVVEIFFKERDGDYGPVNAGAFEAVVDAGSLKTSLPKLLDKDQDVEIEFPLIVNIRGNHGNYEIVSYSPLKTGVRIEEKK